MAAIRICCVAIGLTADGSRLWAAPATRGIALVAALCNDPMGRISSSSAHATLSVVRIIRAASVRIVCATHPVRGRPKT